MQDTDLSPVSLQKSLINQRKHKISISFRMFLHENH